MIAPTDLRAPHVAEPSAAAEGSLHLTKTTARHRTLTQKDPSSRPRKPFGPRANDTAAPEENARVIDAPASGHGRRYFVERELEEDGYDALIALVTDDLARAVAVETIPIRSVPLDRLLEHLVSV